MGWAAARVAEVVCRIGFGKWTLHNSWTQGSRQMAGRPTLAAEEG